MNKEFSTIVKIKVRSFGSKYLSKKEEMNFFVEKFKEIGECEVLDVGLSEYEIRYKNSNVIIEAHETGPEIVFQYIVANKDVILFVAQIIFMVIGFIRDSSEKKYGKHGLFFYEKPEINITKVTNNIEIKKNISINNSISKEEIIKIIREEVDDNRSVLK